MLIESFLDYLQYERNYSEKTVLAYGEDIKQLQEFAQEEYGKFNPLEVEAELIREWIVSLMDKGYTSTSVNRKLSSLRTFYKYLLRQGETTIDPLRKIKGPKNKKPLPVFLKENEMNRLLDETDFGEGFKGCRDRLIIEMFYATGMRLSELIGLDNKDVDFSASLLKVTGKRNKQRLIPFGDELQELMLEYINNIVPVRLYHVEDDYLDRMDALSAEICRLQKRMDAIQIWTDSFQDFIFQAFYRLIIIAVGLYDYQRGNISLGSIMFMLSMSEGLAFCISSLGGYIRKVQEILVSREKFDKLGRRDNPGHLGETELTHIETIEFRNVGFMYADSKDKVFEKVNLLFQRGEDYRIVGDNGSGKSTLLKLMFGLYETETGKILINGTDSSADVYGRIVYVPQEPDIFGETLRYNLLVDHTEIQMEEIERALQTVELFAWYSTLPERLDTMLKEKGKNISKGQKARIAVARALLNQPDFIVMDEIDANIDASMVQRLMENVRINYPDCSIVAVTHRGEGDVYMDFRVLRVAKKRVEVCQV